MLKMLAFFGFVWGILEIILFFKVWGMTNDVHRLVNYFCKLQDAENTPTAANDEPITADYDRRLDTLKPGDKVKRYADGKMMEVLIVNTSTITCRAGRIDGSRDYPKESLVFVE